MGWFNKKEQSSNENIPSLPELPKLPELPRLGPPNIDSMNLPQLPSMPDSPFGRKFSQSMIKDAVSGEKEDEQFEGESFGDIPNAEIMPKFPQMPLIKKMSMPSEDYRSEFTNSFKKSKKPEPVFIRIDKFEESLEMFENAKKKIAEMEDALKSIKKTKEEEEKEIKGWEMEIQKIKSEFEKIDSDLFSRI